MKDNQLEIKSIGQLCGIMCLAISEKVTSMIANEKVLH